MVEGKALLNQAFAATPEGDTLLKLWFYRLAHFPNEFPEAEAEIRSLLNAGVRSEGWDFTANIAQTQRDGHTNIALLHELATAISQSG